LTEISTDKRQAEDIGVRIIGSCSVSKKRKRNMKLKKREVGRGWIKPRGNGNFKRKKK